MNTIERWMSAVILGRYRYDRHLRTTGGRERARPRYSSSRTAHGRSGVRTDSLAHGRELRRHRDSRRVGRTKPINGHRHVHRYRAFISAGVFEAFYSSDPLEHDGHGSYRPLMVAYVPDGSMGEASWAHVYQVRRDRGTGMLFADPYLGHDMGNLMRILGIVGRHGGNPWSARKFLDHVQSSSAGISSHWSSHRIRTALDLPAAYRKDVEESDKVYWCGWRQNPPGKHQSEANYQKTLRWLGGEIAELCRSMNVSTCWSADPDAARTDFPLTLADFRKHGLTHGWPSRIS